MTTSATRPPGVTSDERRSRSSGRAPTRTKQRHAGAPLHQVLDEIEQQRLGPVQVVDHQHAPAAPAASAGEEAADDEERLLGRGRRAGEQRGDAAGDARCARRRRRRARASIAARSASAPAPSSMPRQRAQRLGERREGGAAGGVAVRRERRSPSSPRRRANSSIRRDLPSPGEPSSTARRGRRRRRPPSSYTAVRRASSSSRPTNGAAAAPAGALERHDAIRRHRLGAALERDAAERLERDQRRDQPPGRLADHHVAVAAPAPAGAPRRSPDRRRRRVVAAHHHLAGVDRDAQPDRAERRRLLARPARGTPPASRRRRARRGCASSSATRGTPKAAITPSPSSFTTVPPCASTARAHRRVVALHEAARRLGVEALVQRRRADEVGEDDRHDLARAGVGSGRRAASGARRRRRSAPRPRPRRRTPGSAAPARHRSRCRNGRRRGRICRSSCRSWTAAGTRGRAVAHRRLGGVRPAAGRHPLTLTRSLRERGPVYAQHCITRSVNFRSDGPRQAARSSSA